MSLVALSGNASGTGTLTIAAPNTNSNRTLTLPDATTTFVGTDATQTLTNKTLTTPNIDSAQIPTVSGTAPLYMCRAWVNFDGTKDTTGAVSTANTNRLIRASGNVTSVLRNAIGDYTITFTTAMTDANYALNVTSDFGASNNFNTTAPTTTTARISTYNTSTGTAQDRAFVGVTVFR